MRHIALKSITLFGLLINHLEGISQTKYKYGAKSIQTTVYQPIDIVFKLKEKTANHLFDASLGSIFSKERDASLSVHGFYNGNNEYIIHFAPPQSGTWTFQAFSSSPSLSGLKGKIVVTDNTHPNIHGAVTISPNAPQKFVFQDVSPYFALTFELDWLFALDYENKNAIPKTEQIISQVKAQWI